MKQSLPKTIEPRTCNEDRWGIYNGRGQFWTPETFRSVEDAEKHMVAFWGADQVPSKHRIVPVTITIEFAL